MPPSIRSAMKVFSTSRAFQAKPTGIWVAVLGKHHLAIWHPTGRGGAQFLRAFSTGPAASKDAAPIKEHASTSGVAPTTLRQPLPPQDVRPVAPNSRASGSLPADQLRLLPPLAEVPGKALDLTWRGLKATGRGLAIVARWTGGALHTAITNPTAARANSAALWADIKHEAHHYWVGSKLLVTELSTSAGLLRKVGGGSALTRRERLQLKRTLSDLLRMVPFIIIVIIPFAELGLPVLLKLFPNMLPSQFEKAEFRQAAYKRSLNARLELHGVLQEILADRVAGVAAGTVAGAGAVKDTSAADLLGMLEAVRRGDRMPPEAVVAVARLFKDEVTVDTLPRGQLATLAKYMSLSPYSPEVVLRAQLRTKLSELKEDDRLLALEGTIDLNKDELKKACEERGMRAVGLSEEQYRAQLDEWLDLSVKKEVPATLLLLSRSFQIATVPSAGSVSSTGQVQQAAAAGVEAAASAAAAVQGLQESISSIDTHTVAEAVALVQPVTTPILGTIMGGERAAERHILEAKLEAVEYQNTMIAAEKEAEDAAAASAEASSIARARSLAAHAAASDPARASEVTSLRAQAAEAEEKAAETAKKAEAKKAVVLRMRSSDAARAAAMPPSTPKDEVTLLANIAAKATVGREKGLLAKLKAVQARIEADGALSRMQAAAPPAGGEDATTSALRAQLATLTRGLEVDIAARGAALSSALAAADRDHDGSVNAQDLAGMLAGMVKGVQSEEAAAALIKRLDKDGDGHVTLAELERHLDGLAQASAATASESK